MGKVDARQSFRSEMTGNSLPTPFQLGDYSGNSSVNTSARCWTVTKQ